MWFQLLGGSLKNMKETELDNDRLLISDTDKENTEKYVKRHESKQNA